MITVTDYLRDRFSRSSALTRREAELIGLKWPLKSGWVSRFANVQIPDDKAEQLKALADCKMNKNSLARLERKERNRLNKLVKVGAMSRADADVEIKAFAPAQEPRKPKKLAASNDGFYVSREWRDVRYKALVKHGAVCQCCGSSRADGKKLHVDHIKPRSKFPELQLELSNLQILCEDCNLGKSNKDATDWR